MNNVRYIAVIITCLLLTVPAYAGSLVTDMYYQREKNEATLTLVLSDVAEYKIFTLSNPDRLVIDLPNTSWNAGGMGIIDELISKMRRGEPRTGDLRIVLNLTEPVQVEKSSFLVAENADAMNKLVISISGKSDKLKKKSSVKNFSYTNAPSETPVSKSINQPEYKNVPKASMPLPEKSWSPSHHKPIIIIDAGHGGMDPGAIGKSGIKEKTLTLQYALDLKKVLDKTGRYTVVLTRSKDRYVNLASRVENARGAGGELFISLHADSNPNSETAGLSVYTLSEKRVKREGDKLADKADTENVLRGVNLKRESNDVQRMLIDLAQRDTKNTSSVFAEMLVKELGAEARLLEKTHRFGSFAVLTGADIPSVLIELGYLSNRNEEKLLRTGKYRNKLINGITDAIDKYFRKF